MKTLWRNQDEATLDQCMIQTTGLEKCFTVGEIRISVLDDITFQVDRGEFVAIVGPSGSGKSTLLNMITGIDRPSKGSVEVAGQRIDKMSENELAKWRGLTVGIVFQFFQLMPSLNLVDNVMLPMDFAGATRPNERRDKAMTLLRAVGLESQALKLPGAISGGQQQRAAIARALANDPPLLVCDEPTGNLDTATTEQMFDLFLHLTDNGKTLVIVTHNLSVAERTPRMIHLVDGQIIPSNAPVKGLG